MIALICFELLNVIYSLNKKEVTFRVTVDDR
jgi:hypothetical protein